MEYLRIPSSCTSFYDTNRSCRAATELNIGVVCEILGEDRYFTPGMNPHEVYNYNEQLFGLEVLRDQKLVDEARASQEISHDELASRTKII